MIERIRGKTTGHLMLCVLATLLVSACGGDEDSAVDVEKYLAVRSETLAFYLEMHPLRGSRLGSRGTDSLLYTYSAGEMRLSRSKLSGLEGKLRKLPTAGLDIRQIEDSRLLLNWIRSERYALGELRYYRFNPILYCWILEEALWSIPLRIDPPYEAELEAYERRRLWIPALLRNATSNMDNPAKPHIEFASRRVRRLLGNLPALDRAISERYGRSATLPDSVARAITGFLGFLEGTLSSRTRGNMILGTENMAKMFRYGEMIELDPAGLIREGEKQIRRLKSELASLERSGPAVYPASGVNLEGALDTIINLDSVRGLTKGPPRGIELEPGRVPRPMPSKNGNLGIPPLDSKLASLVSTSPLSAHPCAQRLLYEGRGSNGLPLLYDALRALSTRETDRRLCIEKDSVRTILGSDLYRYIVGFMETEDLIDAFQDERIPLRIMFVREKISALALMTLFFEIHAGTMTTEAAIDYLVKTLSLEADEAASEVMTATYAPAVAHPGIALLYLDRMMKKASGKRDSTGPETRVRKALEKHLYLPPTTIIEFLEP